MENSLSIKDAENEVIVFDSQDLQSLIDKECPPFPDIAIQCYLYYHRGCLNIESLEDINNIDTSEILKEFWNPGSSSNQDIRVIAAGARIIRKDWKNWKPELNVIVLHKADTTVKKCTCLLVESN